jgi:very-short-patch-repair endonuclease
MQTDVKQDTPIQSPIILQKPLTSVYASFVIPKPVKDVPKCVQCGKTFTRKANLKVHLVSCKGIRKGQCPQCLQFFLNKIALWRHKKICNGSVAINTIFQNVPCEGGKHGLRMIVPPSQLYLFGEHTEIRVTPDNQLSILDIFNVLAYKKSTQNSYRQKLKHVLDIHPEFKQNVVCYTFSESKSKMPVVNMNNVRELITYYVRTSKMPTFRKSELMKACGIDVANLYLKRSTEHEHVELLSLAFKSCSPQYQYAVGKYRIDLYLEKVNIAVECDEYNHRSYDSQDERVRNDYISKELHCHWIRYNPYMKGFHIGNVVNAIFEKIMKDSREIEQVTIEHVHPNH